MSVFDDAPQRDANVLVTSAHDASCRACFAAARFLRDVARAAGSPLGFRRLYRPAISRQPRCARSTHQPPFTVFLAVTSRTPTGVTAMAAPPDVHPAEYRRRRRAAGVPGLGHSINGGFQEPGLPPFPWDKQCAQPEGLNARRTRRCPLRSSCPAPTTLPCSRACPAPQRGPATGVPTAV